MATFNVTSDNTYYPGTLGDDTINTQKTNDTIDGLSGNDLLNAEFGDGNMLVGGMVDTNFANDTLISGSGVNDHALILGGNGDDSVYTGDGNDIVHLGNGNDTVYAPDDDG